MKELILCDTIQRIIGGKHALQEKKKARLMFKIIFFFKKQKQECKGMENLGCEKQGWCEANNGQVVLCHWRPDVKNVK